MSPCTIPPARAFHASGVGHNNCATIVHQDLQQRGLSNTDSTWVALSHVIGFAAEAALKAYLSTKGVSRDELSKKPLGHNLANLLTKAESLGLEQDGANMGQAGLVKALNRYVSLYGNNYANYDYRYIESSQLDILDAGAATAMVLKAIEVVLDISDANVP